MVKRVCVVMALVVAVGCGKGGDGGGTPAGPSPAPQPQTNRNPSVTSVQVSPTFGIADLQVFSFSATASDADGDPLTYSWSVGGGTYAGSSGQLIFSSPGGIGRATVTVSDGRGGTGTGSVDFIVGSMQGTWSVVEGPLVGASFTLAQSGAGLVTGSFSLPGIGSGNTDPAEPGRITVAGDLTMRVKIGAFADFNMAGKMDSTGARVTGSLRGSGFTGQPFVMVR